MGLRPGVSLPRTTPPYRSRRELPPDFYRAEVRLFFQRALAASALFEHASSLVPEDPFREGVLQALGALATDPEAVELPEN